MSDQQEPSKMNANYNSTMGMAKDTLGSALGATDLAQQGQKQKADGDAEYKAAQAQEYAEGAVDAVSGKVNQVYGAVTGDTAREIDGKVTHDAGKQQKDSASRLLSSVCACPLTNAFAPRRHSEQPVRVSLLLLLLVVVTIATSTPVHTLSSVSCHLFSPPFRVCKYPAFPLCTAHPVACGCSSPRSAP